MHGYVVKRKHLKCHLEYDNTTTILIKWYNNSPDS